MCHELRKLGKATWDCDVPAISVLEVVTLANADFEAQLWHHLSAIITNGLT